MQKSFSHIFVKDDVKGEGVAEGLLINPQPLGVLGDEFCEEVSWKHMKKHEMSTTT